MKPERWQQIDQLLEAALEQEESQRAAFLEEACAGDEALHKKVEALLEAHQRGDNFLEEPALEMAAKGLANDQVSSLVGKQIGSYKILSLLGAGGMGEVYLAQDTTLDRQVALKFLPDELQQDTTARKRFLREAKSAAALDHPFICHIHEMGETEGKFFIAMEYVQGETLQDKLDQGPLPLSDALEKATEIAEALEAAHKKEIVHRDLKPSNIMLTPEGHVKVMDFGLAKRVTPVEGQEEEITTKLTQQGSTLGTVPYMSPEQIRGQAVDTQSDIFSFGIVLFEMLTGVHPFKKASSLDTASSILREEPSPLSDYVPELPEVLQHTVQKMLAKRVEDRCQSAVEVRIDLEQLTGGVPFIPGRLWLTRRQILALTGLTIVAALTTLVGLDVGGTRGWLSQFVGVSGPPRIQSLAVLPLVNLSGDPEQEYFAAGMHEALITDLAKLTGFRKVIGRASVMRYQNTDKPLAQVARELGVDVIITGSVFREGDRVRITAQLIKAETEEHLWAERYERELRDVLSLQNEIVVAITREINLQLTPQEQERLASARTVNPKAHELYLKGVYFLERGPGGLEKANQYFQQAIESDPSYAQAYARLAWSYMYMGDTNLRPPIEVLPKAKAAAIKAQELDEMLAETRIALATIKRTYERDWRGAEREYELAIQLNPGYSQARFLYAWHLSLFGRHDEALAQAKQARSLDPVSIMANRELGRVLYWARRYDEAITQYRATIDLHPTDALTHVYLTWAYLQKGMYKEALAQFQESLTVRGANPEIVASVERAFELGGIKGALQWILEFQRAQSKQRRVSPGDFAVVHALLGEKDQAFEWLEKAYREYDNWMFQIHDPVWDSLRSDPRFQDLLRRLNLPT